jgi:thioredoxin-dependent peroxiredoxin
MTHASATLLSAGLAAPIFQAEDIFGKQIDLQAYRGRPILLSFFRNAACAICNLQVHKLIQKYPAWQAAGLEIIAVFESPRENMLQYVGKQDAPFPIIGDPQARLYDLYGVETSEEKVKATMAAPNAQNIIQEAAAAGYTLTPEAGSNFHRIPADFLIDAEGIIRQVFYADVIGEHMPFTDIEAFLAQTVTH